MIRTAGRGPGSRANGSFPKGARRLSEKSPARHPPPHQPSPGGSASATPPQGGSDCPGSAGVPPASCSLSPGSAGVPPAYLFLWPPLSFSAMLQAATLWAGTAAARPKESHGAVPVDPSGGDGRGCARLGAGGTPALPGSRHPMTSSHQGHQIAEAFWCRLWLKEVHLSSCLFVSIRGSSSLTIGRFSSNDPHGRAGARLAGKREFPKGCTSAF